MSRFVLVKAGGAVLSTGGATQARISTLSADIIAPTATPDTGTIEEGAASALFDVLANDVGTAPFILSNPVIVSGSGSVAIDGTELRFTPPATAQTVEIDYTVTNTAGSDTGRLTITVTPSAGTPPAATDDFGVAQQGGPVVTFNVLVNDTGDAQLSLDSYNFVSGGGTVVIVNDQIEFTPPATAGTTEIDYVVSNAFGTDTGRLTITTQPAAVAPVSSSRGGYKSTANFTPQPVATGLVTPANTRAFLVFVYSKLGFGPSDPQPITNISLDYAGTAMNRVDGYGNSFKRGDAPAIFTFLLNLPGDTIPASGNLTFDITLPSGSVEFLGVEYVFITDPNDDVLFSVLHENYPSSTGTSIDSPFTPDDASLIFNASAINGLGAWIGDGADWTEVGRQEVIDSAAALSGAIVVEERTFVTGSPDTHTLTSNNSEFRSTITVQFQGQGAPTAQPPVATDDTGDVVTNAPAVLFDVLANDTGDAPLVIQSVNIVSGPGSAQRVSNRVEFTPSGVAGVTEIDYVVGNGVGTDTGRLTITTAAPTPPTAVDDTFSTNQAGIPVLLDVLANDTGSGPLTLVSVTPIAATGVASVVSGQVEYISPAGSGTDTFTVTVSNAAGTDTSTLTVDFSDITLGPRVGPAVGIGITGTAASVDVAIQAALVTFRNEIQAKQNRGLTDQQIRDANPGYVDLTGTTGQALLNAWNSGNRNLILLNDRQYNWSDIGNNNTTPTQGINLVGLNGANVIVGGTPLNNGQLRFLIRGPMRAEGITFRDGAALFSVQGLANAVSDVILQYCSFDNMGNSLHHELGAGVSPNMELTNLNISFNRFTNVRNGVRMRMGTGAFQTAVNVRMGTITLEYNHVDSWNGNGISIFMDGPPFQANWPIADSTTTHSNNLIENQFAATEEGWALNLSGTEYVNGSQYWGINNTRAGSGFDVETYYTKSKGGYLEDSVIWNTGQNDFQGMIALKGQDSISPTELEEFTVRNILIGHTINDIDNHIFVQRSNAKIRQSIFIKTDDSNPLTQQGVENFPNLEFTENLVRAFSGGFAAGASVSNNVDDWVFEDTTFEINNNGVLDVVTMQAAGAAESVLRPVFRRCTFINTSGNTQARAINAQIFAPSFIQDLLIEACVFDNVPVAFRAAGNQIQGSCIIRDCTHIGAAPAIQNNNGTSITLVNNSF